MWAFGYETVTSNISHVNTKCSFCIQHILILLYLLLVPAARAAMYAWRNAWLLEGKKKTTQNQPKQNPTKTPQTSANANNLKCVGSKILEPVSAFSVRTWTLARLTSLPEACSQLFSQRDPQGGHLKASSSFYTFRVSSRLSLLSLITPGSMLSALLSFHPSNLGCAGRLLYLWNPWKQCRLFHRNM